MAVVWGSAGCLYKIQTFRWIKLKTQQHIGWCSPSVVHVELSVFKSFSVLPLCFLYRSQCVCMWSCRWVLPHLAEAQAVVWDGGSSPFGYQERCNASSHAAFVQVTHNSCREDFLEPLCLTQGGSWFPAWEWFSSQNSASEVYCYTDIIMT